MNLESLNPVDITDEAPEELRNSTLDQYQFVDKDKNPLFCITVDLDNNVDVILDAGCATYSDAAKVFFDMVYEHANRKKIDISMASAVRFMKLGYFIGRKAWQNKFMLGLLNEHVYFFSEHCKVPQPCEFSFNFLDVTTNDWYVWPKKGIPVYEEINDSER